MLFNWGGVNIFFLIFLLKTIFSQLCHRFCLKVFLKHEEPVSLFYDLYFFTITNDNTMEVLKIFHICHSIQIDDLPCNVLLIQLLIKNQPTALL